MGRVDTSVLVAAGRDAGLVAVGVASAEVFTDTLEVLEARKRDGLHAGMQFTYRNPHRSTDPRRTLPGAQSLVVGALDYERAAARAPTAGGPHGRIAAYAREDLYGVLRAALEVMAAMLREAGHRSVVVADQNNLVDRAAAYRAGLGWWGKSSNILVPEVGSMVVLGAVITDAQLDPSTAPPDDACGACVQCLAGCPTGAIIAPGVVDSRRCLAWLVQAEGTFPVEFRAVLGDRIYGCDDCQDVCPPNRVRVRRPARGATANAWAPLIDLLAATDDELLERYGRWYVPRRDPRYLRRNALVVLGNIGDAGDETTVATLGRYIAHADPLLRAHAVWAARRLGADSILPGDDPDPEVALELRRAMATS